MAIAKSTNVWSTMVVVPPPPYAHRNTEATMSHVNAMKPVAFSVRVNSKTKNTLARTPAWTTMVVVVLPSLQTVSLSTNMMFNVIANLVIISLNVMDVSIRACMTMVVVDVMKFATASDLTVMRMLLAAAVMDSIKLATVAQSTIVTMNARVPIKPVNQNRMVSSANVPYVDKFTTKDLVSLITVKMT